MTATIAAPDLGNFNVSPEALAFVGVVKSMAADESRLGRMEGRLTTLEADCGEIKGRLSALELGVARLEERFKGMEKSLSSIRSAMFAFNAAILAAIIAQHFLK